MKKEALETDPQSLDNRSLSAIARNPNHPLHTHARSELDRRKMKREEKDPEEYDNEGSMMKGQLRQICSANEKLMSMVKDDDNLPEWVQSKVTKATDYIRSVRDYLESEKMDESTKVSATEDQAAIDAFLKKGGKITKVPAAKAQGAHGSTDLERNVSGQLGSGDTNRFKTRKKIKSMEAFEPHMMYDPKTGKSYKAKKPEDHERMAKMGYSHDKPKVNEVSSKTLSNYMRKSAADAGKPRQSARTQDKRIGGQKMADDKLRKMDGKGSAAKVAATNEVLDTPKARNSYYDKAKSSKDRATNSAVANILRKSDHSADLKTRSKREKGIGMVKNKAINALRKEESVNELSKDTMQSYWDKTKGDDAFSGSRKANNRLKGAINVTTKLDRLKKMGNRKKVKSMEATQVDEISKDTKKSYIKKAVGDIDNRSFAQGLRDKNPTYTSVDSKNNRKIANRRKGIDRALEAKETDPPFDNAKPIQKDTKDKFGNLIKNRAKHLARKTARDLANKEK